MKHLRLSREEKILVTAVVLNSMVTVLTDHLLSLLQVLLLG
ncbi:hypothetical protein [Streptomyces sp. HUAS TT3]